jgi:hypothetical protein
MEDLSVQEIVDVYVVAAAKHARATEAGDYKAANEAHDVIAPGYRELRTRGLQAQRALLPLLEHPDPGVRGWAAAHGLEFAPDQAEPTLEALAGVDGLGGSSAKMTLQVWRKGDLNFP